MFLITNHFSAFFLVKNANTVLDTLTSGTNMRKSKLKLLLLVIEAKLGKEDNQMDKVTRQFRLQQWAEALRDHKESGLSVEVRMLIHVDILILF